MLFSTLFGLCLTQGPSLRGPRNPFSDSFAEFSRERGLFGAPKGGCFDQGWFSKCHLVVFVVPPNAGIYSIKKGVVFKCSSRGFRSSRGFECEKMNNPLHPQKANDVKVF